MTYFSSLMNFNLFNINDSTVAEIRFRSNFYVVIYICMYTYIHTYAYTYTVSCDLASRMWNCHYNATAAGGILLGAGLFQYVMSTLN